MTTEAEPTPEEVAAYLAWWEQARAEADRQYGEAKARVRQRQDEIAKELSRALPDGMRFEWVPDEEGAAGG